MTLFVKPPGASSYSPAASDTSGASSGSFTYTANGGDGSYSFYTVATDQAGNFEPAPTSADATTLVDASTPSSSAARRRRRRRAPGGRVDNVTGGPRAWPRSTCMQGSE